MQALTRQGVSCSIVPEDAPADLRILCAWPGAASDLAALRKTATRLAKDDDTAIVVVEAPDPLGDRFAAEDLDAWNAQLKATADDLGGHFVPIRSKFLRWGPRECLEADFRPSQRGAKSIANAIAKLVVREQASASISDEDVTLTCARTGQSLRELLETDPAAADELLISMCSSAAEARPGFFWSDQPINSKESNSKEYDQEGIEAMMSLAGGFIAFPARLGWPRIALGQGTNVDWTQTGPDRSWQSMFLALEFLAQPLDAVWKLLSSGPASLDGRSAPVADVALTKALQVFGDFQKNNPPHDPVTPRIWHEGTASRRLRALFALLSCCILARHESLMMADGALARIGLEIARTAHLLSSEATYIEAGNHGVRQDYGLYTIGRILSGSAEAVHFRALALRRLDERQLKKCLSADSVWLEHSTGYHGLVLDYLITMERTARQTGDTDASDILRVYISRMSRFFDLMLLPNKTVMMIGDTASHRQDRGARRVASYETVPNYETVGMFPDAGYMICRPPHDGDDTGIHLAFYANLKSSKHKQADDLSIFLQEGLTPWLVDGGTINKETSDPRRNAARFDPGAHSTYRVNGGGYSFNRRSADEVGFISTHEHEDWCGACAVNRLYEGGEVTRFVVYVAEQRLVVAIDHLLAKGDGSAKFEQFWHLAPGSVITPREGGFLAVQDGYPTHLNIAVDSAADDSWDQWEGGEGRPLGWTMTGWNKVVPNPVLRRSFASKERWCATAFELDRMPRDHRRDSDNAFAVQCIESKQQQFMMSIETRDNKLVQIRLSRSGEISVALQT